MPVRPASDQHRVCSWPNCLLGKRAGWPADLAVIPDELVDADFIALRRAAWSAFGGPGAGLSASVLTQLTDVEVETNGLMTDDRAVVKLDPELDRKLNESIVGAGRGC